MSKRRASSSSVTDEPIKRQKTNVEATGDAPTFAAATEDVTQPEDVPSPNVYAAANDPEDADVDGPVPEPVQADTKTKGKKKAETPKQPPVKDAFNPWEPTITHPPKNDFWGIKPVTGDPRPHPDQPPARDSDAATNPPMWEDRNYRFKRGSRYVKYFGPIKPEGADDGPDLDQEDLLVMRLIDMRPKSRHDQSPRRVPTSYHFEHGKPKDWNSMQAIKALNDRRGQAIDRITVDSPWSKIERQYLSELINELPDASIWELTECHNDRFMKRDFIGASGFTFTDLSAGRTVESVRHEYMTYRPAYDAGTAPENVRYRTDKSFPGKELRKHNSNKMEQSFGKPDKKLAKEFDEEAGENEEDGSGDESGGEGKAHIPKSKPQKKSPVKKAVNKDTPKKTAPKKQTTKKSSAIVFDTDASDSDDEGELQKQAAQPMATQPKLNDDDEALLDLAGVNNPEEIRNSPPHVIPSASPSRRAFSWSSGSDVSDILSDISLPKASMQPAEAAKSRASCPADNALPQQDVKSPGAVAFEDAVAAVSDEIVADVVASQQARSPRASFQQASEREVIFAHQTATVVEQHSTRSTTPERSSPAPSQAPKTPSTKAARDIEISDNYDDEEEEYDDEL